MSQVDDYIERFSPEVQIRLKELRDFIKSEVPEAEEKIAYGMPSYHLKGALVYFGAFKNHFGFFPTASGIKAFEQELAPFITGKGTLSFPLDKPFPWEVLRKVIRFKKEENLTKTGKTSRAKKKDP